jgi:Endosomal/lysosomal potassium channel TMEM175
LREVRTDAPLPAGIVLGRRSRVSRHRGRLDRRLPAVADEDASGTDPRDTGNPWTTRIWLRRGDGLEFDRLPVFCDAVFAIAITLVAVEIGVPEVDDATSAQQLWAAVVEDVPTIVAFFITFAVLASYWLANHRFMSALRGYTVGFRVWTMTYLATIAFLPYPAATFGRYPDNPVAVSLLAVRRRR